MALTIGGEVVSEVLEASALAQTPAIALDITGVATGTLLYSRPCVLVGIAAFTTNASAVTMKLFDGPSASGTKVATVILPTAANANPIIPDAGVMCDSGLFMTLSTSATADGAVYVRDIGPQ